MYQQLSSPPPPPPADWFLLEADWIFHAVYVSGWPSGLRRQTQGSLASDWSRVFWSSYEGVGSNPTSDIFFLLNWNLHLQKNTSPNVGLEPTTPRLRVSCSTDWASRALLILFLVEIKVKHHPTFCTDENIGGAGNWTRGLTHAKRALYRWATPPTF